MADAMIKLRGVTKQGSIDTKKLLVMVVMLSLFGLSAATTVIETFVISIDTNFQTVSDVFFILSDCLTQIILLNILVDLTQQTLELNDCQHNLSGDYYNLTEGDLSIENSHSVLELKKSDILS